MSDEVVEKFNEKFAIIDLEPNVVNFTQALRDVGKLVNGGIVRANFGPCGNRLGDTVREPTNFAHPFATEPANDPLHLGNQIPLQGIERDSGGSEYRVLDEHEDENCQERAALRDRQRARLAD